MSTAGLTKSRIARMGRVLGGYVERKELPGLVALVSHEDDVHVEVAGTMFVDRSKPMRRDTIFRVASITKPVLAVAVMILVEDCRLRLDDPVDPWLPELASRRVLRTLSSGLEDSVAAERAITLRDLLTFRMGFGSIMAPPGTYPIQTPIREYCIGGDGPMLPTEQPPADEWLRRLGSLPLMEQPGARWRYQVSADVLGVLVARVAGTSLGEFMHERIFEPLGMKDTAFSLSPDKLSRLPGFYRFDPAAQALRPYEDTAKTAWSAPVPFEAGGGGLLSTVDDYFAFCRMMLGKGRLGTQRVLSRASVELMTSDQVTPEHRVGAELFFGSHSSWGFGMSVDIRRDQIFRTPGRFGWDGGYGTSAYTDPAQRMIGILFTQRMMDSPQAPDLYSDFWTLAYAAIE